MLSARAHQPTMFVHNTPPTSPLSLLNAIVYSDYADARGKAFYHTLVTALSAAPPPSQIMTGTRLLYSRFCVKAKSAAAPTVKMIISVNRDLLSVKRDLIISVKRVLSQVSSSAYCYDALAN